MLAALLPFAALRAQYKSFDALYEAYDGKKGVEAHKAGKLMITAGRAAGHKGIPDGLECVKSLAVTDRSQAAGMFDALEKDVGGLCSQPVYRAITDRLVKGGSVKAYGVPAGKGRIKNLIILTTDGKYLSAIYMQGEFDESGQFVTDLKTKE